MDDAVKLKRQLSRTRIVVLILSVFCIMCLIFAQRQRIEADRNAEFAIKREEEANQMKNEARRLTEIATQQRAEAEQQRMLAVQQAALVQAAHCEQKNK